MTVLRFSVYGNPVPQPRPRFRVITMGKGVHRAQVYTPTKHPVVPWREKVRAALLALTQPCVGGPVRIELEFFLRRPKGHFRTSKRPVRHPSESLRPSAPVLPLSKRGGDIDNLVKPVLDEMNGMLFADDAQVVELRATKAFSDYRDGGLLRVKVEFDG